MKPFIRTISALTAILAAGAPAAAERVWVNNQSARLAIGQPSFTRQNPASSRDVIGSASGVAVGGGRLFIADGNRVGAFPVNNRVLIYENLSSFIPPLEAVPPQDKPCPACVGRPDYVLGQPDFQTFTPRIARDGMRAPSGVATDGVRLAVADTNNNRVLIWNTIPRSNQAPPDVVVGQPDFTTALPDTKRDRMRGPQGVWLDGGKLFVADTQNSRVLIWNSIPTSNGAPADVVIGQPDFDTRPNPDLTQSNIQVNAQTLLDPVSVTTKDGKMFVADLGFDRVLIWFTIPTQNAFPADVVVGQPDMTTTGFFDHDNDPNTPQLRRSVVAMCAQIGPFDDDGSRTPDDDIFPSPIDRTEPEEAPLRYPRRCERTLNFPRFALSDGQRLYIADSGNDRILIYNSIPTQNGAAADVVIGQPNFIALTDTVGPGNLRSPTALAHDGENLYVADPFPRRILVFTPAEPMIALDGVRNGASVAIKATGWVEYDGATTDDGQLISLTLSGRKYEFRTEKGETATSVRDKFIELINADPDGLVTARPFNGAGVFAKGRIKFGGSVRGGDTLRLVIADKSYEFVTADDDQPFGMVDRFAFFANQDPHPLVFVGRDPADVETMLITARNPGPDGNAIPFRIEKPDGSPLTVEVSGETLAEGAFPRRIRLTAIPEGRPGNAITIESNVGGAGVVGATSGGRLTGGSDGRMMPNGTIATIFGENFADGFHQGSLGPDGKLPTELAGVSVFVNGRAAPIFWVAPEQIGFQVPWEIEGVGASTYVRRKLPDGRVLVSIPRANETPRFAPGIFAFPGPEPRRAVALHGQGAAEGTIAIGQGTAVVTETENVNAGILVTIRVNDRPYVYETVADETLETVRDRIVELINAAEDPEVFARAGREGFFSARADVEFDGQPNPGDTYTITINGRNYSYRTVEGDTAVVVRNILVNRINSGLGDPDATARRLELVGQVVLQVVARSLGSDGNDITFAVSTSANPGMIMATNVTEGKLKGGQTPPVVILVARQEGRQGNEIRYSASSSDPANLTATPRGEFLCCGNIPFSLITDENPAIPGETIIVYASGLGFTAKKPEDLGFGSGEPTPALPEDRLRDISVPFVADDFVSSLAGGRTATVQFVGLAAGFVGLYQVNLRLNESLPDDPEMPLHIAQVLFISNTVTIPIRNLRPRDPVEF